MSYRRPGVAIPLVHRGVTFVGWQFDDDEDEDSEEAPVPSSVGKKRPLSSAVTAPAAKKAAAGKAAAAKVAPTASKASKPVASASAAPASAGGNGLWSASEEAALKKAMNKLGPQTPNRWERVVCFAAPKQLVLREYRLQPLLVPFLVDHGICFVLAGSRGRSRQDERRLQEACQRDQQSLTAQGSTMHLPTATTQMIGQRIVSSGTMR